MTYSTLLKEAEKLSATEIKAIFQNGEFDSDWENNV